MRQRYVGIPEAAVEKVAEQAVVKAVVQVVMAGASAGEDQRVAVAGTARVEATEANLEVDAREAEAGG